LIRPGTTVTKGDLIVEFDRQDQIKNSLDRRAELQDLEQQIAKREAQERAARAHDDSEMSWRRARSLVPSSKWARTNCFRRSMSRKTSWRSNRRKRR
jgi:multidrug resistance efflux pump